MASREIELPWPNYPNCPCGLSDCIGMKLSSKTGHVVRTCICPSCRNTRNVKRGKRGQAKTHRALGGQGFTPYHEESGLFYDLTVRPEVKTGKQTAPFLKFVTQDWFRRALSQSERAIPVGIDAKPSVSIGGGVAGGLHRQQEGIRMTQLGRCFVSTCVLSLTAGALLGAALARANDGFYFDAVLLGAFAWAGAHLARMGFRRLVAHRWGFD